MLLGVRPNRADELVAAGHRVRIYVPYGTQWYEYSLRRLQENPKIRATSPTTRSTGSSAARPDRSMSHRPVRCHGHGNKRATINPQLVSPDAF